MSVGIDSGPMLCLVWPERTFQNASESNTLLTSMHCLSIALLSVYRLDQSQQPSSVKDQILLGPPGLCYNY